MVTASFIFKQTTADTAFHDLNDRIRDIALSAEGFLGRKAWQGENGMEAVVYYWRSMEDLDRFRKDATHKLAKSRYREWYAGYRVEIAEVIRLSGDDLFADWPQ